MRTVLAGLACLAMAACGDAGSDGDATAAGYTLEVRATEDEQIYLVTAPDGRVVAGRVQDGASALMEEEAVRALDPPPPSDLDEVMSLRAPGFSLSIHGEEDGAEDAARISINAGGHNIEIDAQDRAGGDRAFVRITGADEGAARDFIREAEELSDETKTQMLAGLGLE